MSDFMLSVPYVDNEKARCRRLGIGGEAGRVGEAKPEIKCPRLGVVVQEELVRVGPERNPFDFADALVVNVGLDQRLGEHVAF